MKKLAGSLIALGCVAASFAHADCSENALVQRTLERIRAEPSLESLVDFRAGVMAETLGEEPATYTVAYSYTAFYSGVGGVSSQAGYETFDQNCASSGYLTLPTQTVATKRQ